MSGDLSFLKLAERVRGERNSLQPLPVVDEHEVADPLSPEDRAMMSETQRLFEASVNAVQTHFKHLSPEDISSPPANWADAVLARQIAMHITIRRLNAPIAQLARELQRVRHRLKASIHTVDGRLNGSVFAEAYEAMAEQAERNSREGE